MKHIAIKYSIIQVGLCFFVDGVEGIEAYPFNFYVYPRSYKNVNPVVTMQCTTTDFNSRNGMDWNRWIKQGMSRRIFRNHLYSDGEDGGRNVRGREDAT